MGCASEATEILLTIQVIKPIDCLEWFLHTLARFTQNLRKMDRLQQASLREATLKRDEHIGITVDWLVA